jgi:hypothetical protein
MSGNGGEGSKSVAGGGVAVVDRLRRKLGHPGMTSSARPLEAKSVLHSFYEKTTKFYEYKTAAKLKKSWMLTRRRTMSHMRPG